MNERADQQAINWLGAALTAFLCILLTYITIALVNGTVQPTFRDVVIGLVGFITAKLSTVYDWCFGTSNASKKKDEIIATQAQTAAAAQGALPRVEGAPEKVVPLAPGESVTATAETKP
jgi:hypothetical protein